ncbi:hypothetical protein [Peristeroidobacter agariperforans]|uniref:hypothetical protein n=1 Tax=Peristeroidobacter agariperforans TaxID=268404 RepID=UPI0013002A97|nr:hypothetical protein [Peristeroidobacter agariperforans]
MYGSARPLQRTAVAYHGRYMLELYRHDGLKFAGDVDEDEAARSAVAATPTVL